jgi:radical SAM superfamily enzyme YgiQ (UPF0313 family)
MVELNVVNAPLDLLLIHPGSGRAYGDLPGDLIAVEPPLWCRLIAGYAADRGYSVRIIDAEANGLAPSAVGLDAFALAPRVACIVAYGHQPSASTQQMDTVYAIARSLRTCSAAKIAVVGGHVSALPEQTLRECEAIDYVCAGEGPATLCDLLQGKRIDHVPGLMWRGGGGSFVKNMPFAPIEDLSLYHGDMWHKLPMGKYRAHNWQCLDDLTSRQPYASIYTSLGCPFACSFCCINAPFGGRRYRKRAPAEVIAEVERLYRRYGVRTLKITDEMFVLDPAHYGAICEGLAALPFADDLNIWAYTRVDTVPPQNLSALRKAGIRWLALGIESESSYVRDGAGKRLRRDDIAGTVKTIQDAGINVIGNYIFGLPDDDLDSMRRTLQMAMDLRTEWANFYSAMAYPGSPLYDEAVKKGWALPDCWSGYSQHGYDTRPLDTRHVDAAAVLGFRDEAFRTYFSSARFLDDTGRKFGAEAVRHVGQMALRTLPRKLLEEAHAPRERVAAQ